MNKHELCPTCRPQGKCQFEEAVNNVVSRIPPSESQTPIEPSGKITIEAFDAHEMISIFREKARENCCPKVNLVNPDYPGKNNL